MKGEAGVVKAVRGLVERAAACYIRAMTTQVLFNPLAYIDRLRRGGFSPEQARASAEALEAAFSESVATKSDVSDIRHDMELLKRDLSEVEGRLKLEISQSKTDTQRWVFGFNLVLIGAIFMIVKFA
jgi:hypothetical protein